MNQMKAYPGALPRLRAVLATRTHDTKLQGLLDAQSEVLARYQPVFSRENIRNLTGEEFLGFLLYRNNRHWTGLHRLGTQIVRDMDTLRTALEELLDENVPIEKRLNRLLPKGRARVRKLGKAILTPILHIAHPERHGVWNSTSEAAIKELGIWPEFERGTHIGTRYRRLNDLFLRIAADLHVDLWTLDSLWWRVVRPADEPDTEADLDEESGEAVARFGLERHLHDFLLDNWETTTLGKQWDLDEDGGDIKEYGYERPTPIGRIDLLAHHKRDPRWLVIELKRGQTSDDTVGQVLRYMGWVREHLAGDGEKVEGLVIAHDKDEKLRYALMTVPDVRFLRYEVDFHLRDDEE